MESTTEETEQVLASRWDRLFAWLIDCAIIIAFSLPTAWLFGVFDFDDATQVPITIVAAQTIISYGFFFAINWPPLKENAQTWGKRVMNIKVVGEDGETLPINDLIFKRYAFQFGIGLIPVAGEILTTVDSLFIFTEYKKCLHDHIAKSTVVNA